MRFHPGKIHISTLLQDRYWVDVTGTVIPIDTIDLGYALNILDHLLKRAKPLSMVIQWNSPDFYDEYGDKNWFNDGISDESRVMETPIARKLRQKILEAEVSKYISPPNPKYIGFGEYR